MGLRVDVHDAAVAGDRPDWDALVAKADLPALWHAGPVAAFAAACRESVLAVQVDDAGEPAMVACYRTMLAGPVRRYRDVPSRPRPVLLRCCPPVSFEPGFAFAPGVERRDRRRLLAAADGAVRATVGRWCRGVVYEGVAREDRELFASARVVVRTSPVAVLPVTWSDLDGYLAGLPRSRARRLAALASRLDAEPTVAAFGPAAEVDAVAASRLEVATRLRHLPARAGAVPLPAAYFDAVLATGRASVFGFRRPGPAGALLQFDLAFATTDRLTTTATGAEDRSKASDLYAGLFLREIAWAGQAGVPLLAFGPGALAEKRRFGCHTEERWAFVGGVR